MRLIAILLLLGACATVSAEDCLEAQGLYDAAPSLMAGVQTATVCAAAE